MRMWQMVLKEARHRKLNFISGLVSVAMAVGCVVGAMALLQAHDARTEAVILEKERETRNAMLRLEDDYRRIMRDMGYNVLILHEDQDITALHTTGVPDLFMPDDYADKLADAKIKSLNHLLPVLQQKLYWQEKNLEVLVAGIKGQIPMPYRQKSGPIGADGTPIMEPVPHNHVDVGFALAERYKLEPGQTIEVNGTSLTVNKCFPQQGAQDDMTLWVHLELAQKWFNKPGLINGILALECICNAKDLGNIIADVEAILPDTQVFEFGSLVRTRALARGRAADAHQEAIEAERVNRANMRREREKLASVLAPLAVLGAAIWILLLTFANVRERRSEIAILRALGYSGKRIIGLFQLRTLIMSSVGALTGYMGGIIAGAVLGGAPSWTPLLAQLFSPMRLVAVLVGAIALACGAAWLPAKKAAAEDPANILREIV